MTDTPTKWIYFYREAQEMYKNGVHWRKIATKFGIKSPGNIFKVLKYDPIIVLCKCGNSFVKVAGAKICRVCAKPATRTCKRCNIVLNTPHIHYCDTCSKIIIDARELKRRKEKNRNCLLCNKITYFSSGVSKYCDECKKSRIFKIKISKKYSARGYISGRDFTRNKVRERDNHTCQICNKEWKFGRKFDVHHKENKKQSKSYDKKSDMTKLVTLCHKCHLNLHHGKFPKLEKEFLL